jgi:hypothetical protein
MSSINENITKFVDDFDKRFDDTSIEITNAIIEDCIAYLKTLTDEKSVNTTNRLVVRMSDLQTKHNRDSLVNTTLNKTLSILSYTREIEKPKEVVDILENYRELLLFEITKQND